MTYSSNDWIQRLDLQKHPEGGYFCEVYRSEDTVEAEALPSRYAGKRPVATSIYYLLPVNHFSAFHRVQSDEVWFFHDGETVILYLLRSDGSLEERHLGNDRADEHTMPTTIVPRNTWFAAELRMNETFALVSCVVAPGFEFADFELADRTTLLNDYPQHAPLIRRLTY